MYSDGNGRLGVAFAVAPIAIRNLLRLGLGLAAAPAARYGRFLQLFLEFWLALPRALLVFIARRLRFRLCQRLAQSGLHAGAGFAESYQCAVTGFDCHFGDLPVFLCSQNYVGAGDLAKNPGNALDSFFR